MVYSTNNTYLLGSHIYKIIHTRRYTRLQTMLTKLKYISENCLLWPGQLEGVLVYRKSHKRESLEWDSEICTEYLHSSNSLSFYMSAQLVDCFVVWCVLLYYVLKYNNLQICTLVHNTKIHQTTRQCSYKPCQTVYKLYTLVLWGCSSCVSLVMWVESSALHQLL